jgi:hypothetical protein
VTRTAIGYGAAGLLVLALAGPAASQGQAPAAPGVRVAAWEGVAAGRLDLSGDWRPYPPAMQAFRQPPTIVQDEGRLALQLVTGGDSIRLGRSLTADARTTPWLVWEWKALVLPAGGDVRDPRRNDQAGRVMVAFEGMKLLLYVWDTTAPTGAEVQPDEFELFRRVLIVVRSGAQDVGRWRAERRNVYEDYRRIFKEEPRAIKLIGLESHSNDTGTRTSMLFGRLHLEGR